MFCNITGEQTMIFGVLCHDSFQDVLIGHIKGSDRALFIRSIESMKGSNDRFRQSEARAAERITNLSFTETSSREPIRRTQQKALPDINSYRGCPSD